MSITQVKSRVGNFTSSGIVALMASNRKGDGFGDAAMTYITEKKFERLLCCSLDTETDARATSWGKLMEQYVFDEVLDTSYTITSQVTDDHPTIPIWRGSKDGTHEAETSDLKAVIDIKCPFTRKAYMELIIALHLGYTGMEAINAIRFGFTHNGYNYPKHKSGEKYYFQLVSNAVINACKYAELVVFMPKVSELLKIKNWSIDRPDAKFLDYMSDEQIPCIPDESEIKNHYVIRFEVPQSDIDLLTERVKQGEQLLIL